MHIAVGRFLLLSDTPSSRTCYEFIRTDVRILRPIGTRCKPILLSRGRQGGRREQDSEDLP
jgi:hypothetical protein